MMDSNAQSQSQSQARGLPVWLTVLICAVLLLLTAGILLLILNTEPSAEREGAVREAAVIVETQTVQRATHRPAITGLGTVIPARQIQLQALVGGRVTQMHPNFTPGARVAAGENLLALQQTDFRNQLARSRAELQTAQADLRIEEGRQRVAKKEFSFLPESERPPNPDLVLRQPQLATAQAAVRAAQAAVDQAELDLSRTSLTAPFPARVLDRQVNLGSVVEPGEPLGLLVASDEYWVETTVPLRQLPWIRTAGHDPATPIGAPVQLRHRSAWPADSARQGTVLRSIGQLDETTRLGRLLVSVPDPLALSPQTEGPPLTLGSILHATIEGRPIPDSVKLNRDYLRSGNTVWLLKEGSLAIREVTVAFQDATYAYITGGLNAGDQIVTSDIANPRKEMDLQPADQNPPADPES